MTNDYFRLETPLHVVDFNTRKDLRDTVLNSARLGVNLDHYLLEFDLSDNIVDLEDLVSY
tara:strand:+ start:296 stop:475 length:180 start_codon:yes stop_codon:yes gene_type:complete